MILRSFLLIQSLLLCVPIAAPARESKEGSSPPMLSGAFVEEKVPFTLPDGRGLQAVIRVPRSAAPVETRRGDKFPVMMIFGGFQEAGKVLGLIRTDAPVILASFDYPFSPPRKFEFPGSLRFAPELKAAIHDTVEGIVALKQELKKRPDVDPDSFVAIGASFGAPFAIEAAARDPEFRRVALIHGFGRIPETAMHQATRSWVPRYGPLAYVPAWLLANLGWWYVDAPTPESAASRLRPDQRVLMISAREDRFIPAESSDSLWAALQASPARENSERLIMPGDHLQPGSDRLIDEIMGLVTRWLTKGHSALLVSQPR